ncbi:MAG TPA: hypothetical protein VJG32_12750 [Anaerolineae bacterium]|nr:hypothetical protein [Anaerolineae bacterium]
MREGLLWFDDDPRRRIDEKVQQAAARYRQKFGVTPDVCYVNPRQWPLVSDTYPAGGQASASEKSAPGVDPRQYDSQALDNSAGGTRSTHRQPLPGVNDQAIDRAEVHVGELRVLPMPTVRPHHFWVGRAN